MTIRVLIALLILGIGFFVGTIFGAQRAAELTIVSVLNAENEATADIDFQPFWDTWGILQSKYPFRNSAPSAQDRLYGAIAGLVASYDDPYTNFFNPEQLSLFMESIEGAFTGIGVEIGIEDDLLTVISPLKNTPAYKAGLMPGDKILYINEEATLGMTIDEAIRRIRGEQGEAISLGIFRESTEAQFDVSIIRDIIRVPPLVYEAREDGVFLIELYTFDESSSKEFENALRVYSASGYKKMIIDMRGNPGGFLDAAIEISSHFIDAGKPVLIEDQGEGTEEFVFRSKGYTIINSEQHEIVILVDGGSASASEIVAGALQEEGVATLIGEQTFGKGSVQELLSITKDTSLKVTVARWLTPRGVSISEGGLTPDIEVIMTPEDRENDTDPQFDAALSYLQVTQ